MALLGLGNPLLDISVVTDEKFLSKYDLKANDAILAEDKHMPMYPEMSEMPGVDYIAGGATQNSMRVAQWVLSGTSTEGANSTRFFGSVGDDTYGRTLQSKALEAGLQAKYQVNKDHPTGTCAVVVTEGGKCRSLVANLAAANHFTKSHIEVPENKEIIANAKTIYISGFFLTVSPETIQAVGELACKDKKTFCMNLSAPFLCEFFSGPMMAAFPFVDILFGNETEAATFATVQKLGVSSIPEIALAMAALPKHNPERKRVVVITQGAGPVVAVVDGKVLEFPVIAMSDAQIVDTNGAGDAFVGGFLAGLVSEWQFAESVKCGIWAATQVIKLPGCTFPSKMDYKR